MISLQGQGLGISIAGKPVCDNFNLTLQAGQVWGLLGRNGVGKTTLLHSLAGLYPLNQGQISLNKTPITQLSRRQIAQQLGLLLQHTEDAFPASVLETVLSGRHPHIPNWQWESPADIELARQALQQVQLDGMSQRPVNQLSGGERQRVNIATLITQAPAIYLLDEPNSHLDLKYQVQTLQYFRQLAQEKSCIVLMSLHDINLAARFCDYLLYLYGDAKTHQGPADKLLNTQDLSELFQHPIQATQINGGRVFTPSFT